MQERNVDFEIGLTPEQWSQLTQTAEALEGLGYRWNGKDPEHIRLRVRDEEALGVWSRLVADEGRYGAHDLEIAQIVFNDGRPYAHLEAIPSLRPPAVNPDEEAAVEQGQAMWVRERWHELLERSGLHFDFGHVSPEQ